MLVRVPLVSFKDGLLRWREQVLGPILWPFNEVHVLVLGRGNSPIHTILCNDNDVGPGEDRIHILHVIDTAEGGLNEVHEVRMGNSPQTLSSTALS